jgi:hypothetical protein
MATPVKIRDASDTGNNLGESRSHESLTCKNVCFALLRGRQKMNLLNLLRYDYWLDAASASKPASQAMWFVVALGAIGFVVCILPVLFSRKQNSTLMAFAISSLIFSVTGIGRLYAIPILGLRLCWLIALLIGISPFILKIAHQAIREGLASDCIRAMTFDEVRLASWSRQTSLAWIAYHLLCASIVIVNLNAPIAVAPALIALILFPTLFSKQKRPTNQYPILNTQSLAPLTFAYFISFLTQGRWQIESVFAGIFSPLLALIVSSAYAFVLNVRHALSFMDPGARSSIHDSPSTPNVDLSFLKIVSGAVIGLTLWWSIWTGLSLRTHGATGSDPYAYTQMGIDLATRGSVFHKFPLMRMTYELDVDSYAVVHVGYKIPQDEKRISTTVWAPGYAVFIAAAYRIAGENGIYFLTPILGMAGLFGIGYWARTLIDDERVFMTAALTIFFTATSLEQIKWQMVPMADIASQFFSILALALAFTAHRSLFIAILCGVALGSAFNIRYTQVLIAPSLAFLLFNVRHPSSVIRRSSSVIACAFAALITALPTLTYHHIAFGNPFITGSDELANFSLMRMPETFWRTLSEFGTYREYGLLAPLILIGVTSFWKSNPRSCIALLLFFMPVFVFHLFYDYLKLRDILSLFPIVSFFAAFGATELIRRLMNQTRNAPRKMQRGLLTIFAIYLVVNLFVLRSIETLALPVTRGFDTFGYMVKEQRASFESIKRLTPSNAIIASSLNSGAIDLYSERIAFRPATWSANELLKFVNALQHENTPIFFLDDGDELMLSLKTLRAHFSLTEVSALDLPYFFKDASSENRRVKLYAIK